MIDSFPFELHNKRHPKVVSADQVGPRFLPCLMEAKGPLNASRFATYNKLARIDFAKTI